MQSINLRVRDLSFTLSLHGAAMQHLENPEEQEVSTTVGASQFFPCESLSFTL